MNMKYAMFAAKFMAAYPEDTKEKPKIYLDKGEVAKLLGVGRGRIQPILDKMKLRTYVIGKTEKYMLPEIMEAVESGKANTA